MPLVDGAPPPLFSEHNVIDEYEKRDSPIPPKTIGKSQTLVKDASITLLGSSGWYKTAMLLPIDGGSRLHILDVNVNSFSLASYLIMGL